MENAWEHRGPDFGDMFTGPQKWFPWSLPLPDYLVPQSNNEQDTGEMI